MAGRGLSEEAVSAACAEGPPITKDFMMQQTMLRVKDPAPSLDFYTRVLGMTLLQKIDFPSMRFSHYFLGYENKSEIPEDVTERTTWTFSRRGTLELTHIRVTLLVPENTENQVQPITAAPRSNWGSESNDRLRYHNGNKEPRGFGHIGISVPDLPAACRFFDDQGVEFVKTPDSGRMKNLAFIQDPDGYLIKIYSPDSVRSFLPP